MQRREPALRSSRAERVAADLEHEILTARLPVGAHLGRRSEIMDRFGISPTVMNETLRILRDRDLVTVRPGPGGGITVASAPPQVRLGALDLSFQPSTPHPLDLFEARLYLEFGMTKAAFERATSDDVAAMRSAMVTMRASARAPEFFDAVLAFHGVVAAAAHIPVLEGMHQLVVTSIKAVLSRVMFVHNHEPMLAKSLDVHDDIVAAIALHDQASFVEAINRHDQVVLTRAAALARTQGDTELLVLHVVEGVLRAGNFQHLIDVIHSIVHIHLELCMHITYPGVNPTPITRCAEPTINAQLTVPTGLVDVHTHAIDAELPDLGRVYPHDRWPIVQRANETEAQLMFGGPLPRRRSSVLVTQSPDH